MKKALIALSGGVDSSVAALIMKNKGYECIGVTMKLLDSDESIHDAEAIAKKLDIEFMVADFREDFKKIVIDYFIKSYENGETPNPCIICNKYLKFGKMLSLAKELGCEKLVTGHYATISSENGRFYLKKSTNILKDQSYFLYSLSQEQLSMVEFPLGNMSKENVRKIAEENGFINANKGDSQDICFVPDGNYVSVIEKITKRNYPEGNFVDINGNILGIHKGIIKYTIGQRKGLGLALPEPMYVKEKDILENKVILSNNDALFEKELIVYNFNWISAENPECEIRAKARIRCRHKEADALLIPEKDGKVRVIFDEPQRAIAKGQALVAYYDDIVLGGGIIL